MEFDYPSAKREDVYENYHGTTIHDPYRWMEATDDPEELTKWISEENKLTKKYISKCNFRDKILKTITNVYNYEKVDVPYKRGEKYYFYKNDGLQNQYVLYERDTLTSEPKLLIDPNTFSKDGTTALSRTFFSHVSKSGSDWTQIHILDVQNRKEFKEVIEFCKFLSVSWYKDGFFYTRYPKIEQQDLGKEKESSEYQKIYYHKLGTDQEEDELIFQEPEYPKRMFGVEVTKDEKYLLITSSETTADKNRLYYVKLNSIERENGIFKVNRIIPNYEYSYTYICNDDSLFYFQTNENANNGKVITLDFDTNKKKEIIPESKDPLDYIICTNQKYLVINYVHDVQDTLKLFDLSGDFIKDLPLPGIGQITSFSGRREDGEIFYKFSSFTCPGTIFRYNFDKITIFYEVKLRESPFSLDDFVTKQIWYSSKDGTKIPMFIVHKKNLELNGKNPTLLYGYGGFNISLKPYCSVIRLAFIHHFNGIFAMPNLRGGLVIHGGSNGGLLTASCANQRPELFGAVITEVGVLDMLRFHKFTIGSAWTSDYGCSDNSEDFKYLIKYSPYHNIQYDTNYPAILVTTSDHDDRVVPLHSFKYTAQLQYVLSKNKNQENPCLIRIETKAGHGAGKPTSKVLDEYADIYSFIANALNLEYND